MTQKRYIVNDKGMQSSQFPTYGTMDGNQTPESNVSKQQYLYVCFVLNFRTTNNSQKASINNDQQMGPEPPKPAVRQKMLKSKLQQQTATDIATSASGSEETNINQQEENTMKSQLEQQVPINGKKLTDLNDKIEQIHAASSEGNNNKALSEKPIITSLPLPADLNPPDERPYPKKVAFIIANEFCERFSYYGMRTVLVLYFRSVLGFSDSNATVSFHVFATLCYLTPILGAILGDSVWGKFKTILYLSIVYLLGECILLTSSIFWDLSGLTVTFTSVGLLLIGIGTGGIKPCVSALGGDQFLPHEESRRGNFFSIFYAAINLGSLLSVFMTPMLRSQFRCFGRSDCYPFAFGVPCVLMFLSIVLFLAASKQYVLTPLPKENVIIAFIKCSYLAFKRKLSGQKAPKNAAQLEGRINYSSLPESNNTSNSNLSTSSDDNNTVANPMINAKQTQRESIERGATVGLTGEVDGHETKDTNHWLYLASDRYNAKSIEDFRSVWAFILLFLPTPVYWCLFDQQSSLWTLQASRMDGRVMNTGFVLEPDQMSVANPLLLLASIPIFQFVIYPSLNRCNILTSPIQKMTVGGILASLTFFSSALIEMHIQANTPSEQPNPGYANLLLVNGLNDCTIDNLQISYVQIPDVLTTTSTSQVGANVTSASKMIPNNVTNHNISKQRHLSTTSTNSQLEPLSSQSIELLTSDSQDSLNNYKFSFKLSNGPHRSLTSIGNTSTELSPFAVANGCPFDVGKENEFTIGPLTNDTAKLLYLEQGNGKLIFKLFNDNLKLPLADKARVRLLYEMFGSYTQAEKRQIFLVGKDNTAEENLKPHPELQFNSFTRNGQVLVSDYIDVYVPSKGGFFTLQTSDDLLDDANNLTIKLLPGTRNLILIHQNDASTVEVRQEVLQDNNYRVSLLYQLIPYMIISVSELMFSVTGIELAYEMAPESMKSVVMGLWSLSVALGNVLTVAVESIHPFDNVVNDFAFYAFLMAADIVVFALIGHFYYKKRLETSLKSN